MNRLILFVVCLLLGCQGKKDPEKVAAEIPVVRSAERAGLPLQSILNWDFGHWDQIDSQPKSVASQVTERCIANPYEGMRRSDGYPENNPHRSDLIQIRVNDVGRNAYRLGNPAPVGTVVIKEKHLFPEVGESVRVDRPFAVAAMIKRASGYDPEHGDWEYAYQVNLPVKDKSLIQGKLANCIGCHQDVRNQDYLFRKHISNKE